MKDLKDWAAVQRVYKRTKSKRETARLLGMSRNTVKSLLAMSEEPVYSRSFYPTKLDAYREQIIEWRCAPYEFNGTRIFRELKKLGYEGSIGPVYTMLRRLDEDIGEHISPKATVRHESPPGDQAQFDWSEYDAMVGGTYTHVICFSMILAASRKKAICFSLRQDACAIYEAVQELFDSLGGVTLELLVDNPKAFVIENNPKSEEEIRYNPHALLLAKHLGTELNACPCYWPRKKGKVERPFSYIEEQFIKGSSFLSMEDLNRRGREFINEWCNEVHTTTKRVPNLHYEQEERHMLQPLPKNHYYMKDTESRKVSPDSYISVHGSRYSVPVQYVDRTLQIRIIYGFRILVYDGKGNVILSVEESRDRNAVITDPGHYDPIAPKVPTSIPQIRRDFASRFEHGGEYLKAAARKVNQPSHSARKIMELQDLYDDSTLDSLIAMAIEKEKFSVREFRELVKDYNSGVTGKATEPPDGVWARVSSENSGSSTLTRDCSYYEKLYTEVNA